MVSLPHHCDLFPVSSVWHISVQLDFAEEEILKAGLPACTFINSFIFDSQFAVEKSPRSAVNL